MPVEEVSEGEISERNKYVEPGTYTKLVDEFLETDMESGKITVEDEDLKEGVSFVPAEKLRSGLYNNIRKRKIDGVKVKRRNNKVYLVRQ